MRKLIDANRDAIYKMWNLIAAKLNHFTVYCLKYLTPSNQMLCYIREVY